MRLAFAVCASWILTAVALPSSPLGARETTHLTFGVYTSDKPTVMFRKFKLILSSIEEKMAAQLDRDVKIKLQIYSRYRDAMLALVRGQVDFVRFGPASYVLVKEENPKIELLAIEENEGERRFQGVIFCRTDSSIESLRDLKGKRFAFGDENSTIGRFLAQAKLVEAGIHWDDLSHKEYLGRHDRVVTAVLHRRFDAGAAKIRTFRKYKDRGLRILESFDNVTKPWVAREGLDPDTLRELREALLSMKDPRALKSIGKKLSGFGRVRDSEYDFVRAGMKRARAFRPEKTASR